MNGNTEILELEVTQEDIDRSIERKSNEPLSQCCVISTAAQRQLGDTRIVSAFGEIYLDNYQTAYSGGEELSAYMSNFDNKQYQELSPRTFVLTKAR